MFENNWFDDCARAIAGPVSRRRALGRILGTLAGVAAIAVRPGRVEAALPACATYLTNVDHGFYNNLVTPFNMSVLDLIAFCKTKPAPNGGFCQPNIRTIEVVQVGKTFGTVGTIKKGLLGDYSSCM